MMTDPAHNRTDDSQSGYEKRDVNVGLLAGLALAATAALIVILLLITDFFDVARDDMIEQTVNQPVSEQLVDLRAREDSALTTYQLLDSTAGRYQIPIERAMELEVRQAQQNRN